MGEGATFSDLVKEAFIDPLRSVLIIDDQYPTWEEVLNSAMNSDGQKVGISTKQWHSDPTNPLRVINQFRDCKPGLIIDIHDGVTPQATTSTLEAVESSEQLADHLHQSDLLVLDYNLEGDNSGLGGAKARTILQSVLANKHFNLIVIHTGENDLQTVFHECLISSMNSCTSVYDEKLDEKIGILEQKLDDLEDQEKFEKGRLEEHFGLSQYIYCRQPDIPQKTLLANYMKSAGELSSLSNWAKEAGLKGGDLKTFLYWAIKEFEKPRLSNFLQKEAEQLKWSDSNNCLWFRTVRGFVVFVEKNENDLLIHLQNALESWKPTPSRLLSAKYRHELNRIGVEAEDRTLLKSHVFAHFYSDICNTQTPGSSAAEADVRVRASKLKDHVSRQSEAISFHVEDEIVKFGEKVVSVDVSQVSDFATHYSVDLNEPSVRKKASAHYNSYISTLPLKHGDDQLDSGHILEINNDFWVCATPACDLQPKQNTIAFIGDTEDLRPFTALRLNLVNFDDLSPVDVNSGEYCFIEKEPGKIIVLGLRASKSEDVVSSKVTWRAFLAKKNGLIQRNCLQLLRPKLRGKNLINEKADANVLAKLRYEYALNYIQKIGTSVSRIGLGYMAIRDEEP